MTDTSPPPTYTGPEGITRATVQDLSNKHRTLAEVREIPLPEPYQADELFCTVTMNELTPVSELDGRTVGSGDRGPATQRLSPRYAEMNLNSPSQFGSTGGEEKVWPVAETQCVLDRAQNSGGS